MKLKNDVPDKIKIRGARVHNLKNIDASIPLGQLVGIAGVSGSGKSSLALGVLYAEGSRRYLESLSTFTRRRIAQAGKAVVDSIEHIPAAVALQQRPGIPSIRSTFGTATELLNHLRLMFSRLGSHCCPNGHLLKPTIDVAIGNKLHCPVCGCDFDAPSAESFSFNGEGACEKCNGTGIVREIDNDALVPDTSLTINQGAVEPWKMFGISWMSKVAEEFGVRADIPFKDLSDTEKDIVYNGAEIQKLILIPSKNGKLFELNATYRNARRAVEEALKRAETEKGLERINKYLHLCSCPECKGSRYNVKALSSLLDDKNIAEVSSMTLDELLVWIRQIPNKMPENMRIMADSLVKELVNSAQRLVELGIGYLSLDRSATTLSTGERQRMQLARAVRNRTTGMLYVLDEPSIGLHPSNVEGLLGVMQDLISDGNSVVFVDHDLQVLRAADYLIEMGPGAGYNGGNIVALGNVDAIKNNQSSIIGRFLAGIEQTIIRDSIPEEHIFDNGYINIKTDRLHTVQPIDVNIPCGRLIAVTGVSGSGKTTIVLEELIPALEAQISERPLPACIKTITNKTIKKIHLIDASPIGINVRSTVVTYSNILDDLRKIFASLPQSKEKGYKAADFSYNTGILRCKTCDGTGQISMDMQFLPDVDMVCPECKGSRYDKSVETLKFCPDKKTNEEGVSLSEIMGLTVEQALRLFAGNKKIYEKLNLLNNLGLGYLTLGESTPALSGGEAQRLKLVSEMDKPQNDALFVFDEPSIGLHPSDIRVLLMVFDKLVRNGATVIVIEHDLDIIANADYVIDMGPGGGEYGGRIVAAGTPQQIMANPESVTGKYLSCELFKRK
jgi:ABC transporter related